MCGPTNVSSPDFSKLTLHDFLLHCDDVGIGSRFGSTYSIGNNLMFYMAWSSCPTFCAEACYEAMFNRTYPDGDPIQYFNANPWESKTFTKRFKLLESNNKAYEIATRLNPSAAALEEFSNIEPNFSVLFPIKRYISDHPEIASAYKGMLPFGKEVLMYYNHIVRTEWQIKNSPTFKDHVRLRDVSNRKALLMGIPSITINNLMYQFGKTYTTPDINNILD
jgi:hypothetical protein